MFLEELQVELAQIIGERAVDVAKDAGVRVEACEDIKGSIIHLHIISLYLFNNLRAEATNILDLVQQHAFLLYPLLLCLLDHGELFHHGPVELKLALDGGCRREVL